MGALLALRQDAADLRQGVLGLAVAESEVEKAEPRRPFFPQNLQLAGEPLHVLAVRPAAGASQAFTHSRRPAWPYGAPVTLSRPR